MQQVDFNGIGVNVIPTNDSRQWYMTLEEVSKAYGVAESTLRSTLHRHPDEVRDGLEKGVAICNTPGGEQQCNVLYREGVIKIGFFMRGERAKAFRQFATDLVVSHLQNSGQDSPAGFALLIEELSVFRKEMNERLDALSCVSETVFGDDQEEIQTLVQKVATKHSVDGRTVWGWIQTNCDVGSYKRQNLRVKNYLKTMLGEGLTLVKDTE